jgi:RNA polymerase sigma factor (sigma-70 family)
MADMELVAGHGDIPGTDTEISDRQQLSQLTEAVKSLSEPMRSVIYYRVVEELKFREIGKRLSVSQNAAQKIFAKALKQLAHHIGWGETSSVNSASGNAAEKMAPGYVTSR